MNNWEPIPWPARFAALKREWFVEYHDNHPDNYELCGSIPGEGDWEWVEPENEAHIALRAEAMRRLPVMLVQLQETYDLLAGMSDRGEIAGPAYSPVWRCDDDTPGGSGSPLWTLMQCIGMTLREIEQRGVELGLDEEGQAGHTEATETGED